MIPGQIHGDSQKPGLDPALTPEAIQLPVRPEEALLRERVGDVGILQQEVQHAVHSSLMLPDDLVEAFRRNGFPGFFYCGVQPRRKCGFHAPSLSERLTECYGYGRILCAQVYTTR